MNKPSLSVIIPTLNEAENLSALLPDLHAQRDIQLEIIVVDGGSNDRTLAIARDYSVKTLSAEKRRGIQLNVGAANASADYLLFIHADSRLLDKNLLATAVMTLTEEEANHDSVVAGHFSLKFRTDSPRKPSAYKYYEAKTKLNRVNTTNGDQGFLISKHEFEQLGGFNEELHFLEDQNLAERIRKTGIWITLPGTISTSARRFEQEGFARRMILSAMIMGLNAIEYRDFFELAPEIYREQPSGTKLNLAVFCKSINQLMWANGVRAYAKRWIGVGKYVRSNAWQLFFVWDVYLNLRSTPFLRAYDRVVEPLTNFVLFDIIAAALTSLWFHITWLWFVANAKLYRRTPMPSGIN